MPPPFQTSPYEFGALDLLSVTQMKYLMMVQFTEHADQRQSVLILHDLKTRLRWSQPV